MTYSHHSFPGAVVCVPSANSVTGLVYMNQEAYDAWLTSIGEKAPKPLEVVEVKPGRCECGSTAAGSSRHSTWCPAFEK